ncbi:MAG: sodium:solute symporter family protein [Burkholderiales bacterium]|nr:sodium:solute symporter family protein [Burkholderiales bacterium]
MLLTFVIAYLALSIVIGVAAAVKVHSARDYITTGRRLPIYVVFAAVFATWFGAETVLGIPATFLREGLSGLASDPFGAALCLVLVGIFFARPLYRLNLLTIGDYYRLRYNRAIELACSIAIALSYLGWVSAQVTALGLVFNVLSADAIPAWAGMAIGAAVVLVYTLFGGMWSVAVTTFVQMIVIVLGLAWIAWLVSDLAGGVAAVVTHAAERGRFRFLPAPEPAALLAFVAAWITLGFGSIPQQDVFQRVNASRDESTAAWGSILGGGAYFLFAAVPLFLAYAASLVDPGMVAGWIDRDAQRILPSLIMNHLPLYAQVVFYGALLSVVMSTASATLLAPSVTIAENVLRGFIGEMTDRAFLWMTRAVVACFTLLVTLYAVTSTAPIHAMVENAYKVTLVTAFVPLACGLYWKRATTQGAALALACGLVTWLALESGNPDGLWPPQLAGFLAALAGMVAGSLLPQRYGAAPGVSAGGSAAGGGREAADTRR